MTLVVVPFCAMLAPCSMLSRTPRAAPKERGAGSKIPLDNPSPIQGLELANVVLRRAGPNSLVSQNILVPETFRENCNVGCSCSNHEGMEPPTDRQAGLLPSQGRSGIAR